ncbi:MAG: hypothetical protein A2Z51_03310 [Deltaproteobacteria bacterium RBG_19FT_COMBO_52_11]|nr:MAG: hypothetical protein A2Z51_03310 [Deltaproteobacteria bacterium RBG_19FT_COMBO_52_11]
MSQREGSMADKNRTSSEKFTKRVKFFLSLEPVRIIEGTVTLTSLKGRLSDMVNDERTFLSVQDVAVPDGWIQSFSKFILLNKKEIKAMVEID